MQQLLVIQVNVFRLWAISSLWLMFCRTFSAPLLPILYVQVVPVVQIHNVNKDGVPVVASPHGENVKHTKTHSIFNEEH